MSTFHQQWPDGRRHAQRVGRTAVRIASRMGLDADFLERLRAAAPLHDIGKLTIPREILAKPGPLTEAEQALVETHARAGARLLADAREPRLRMAAEIAESHHEHWDGSGYPNGLAGEEIPLSARIVAVADVFDALVHDRPYKPVWPYELAVGMIVAEAGSQFDPEVVDAFLASQGRVMPTPTEPPALAGMRL
jgi:putative two-component system response regulator